MDVNLKLNEKQIKEFIRFYEEKKKGLFDQMNLLKNEIKEVDALLAQLIKQVDVDYVVTEAIDLTVNVDGDPIPPYNPKMSKAKKAAWTLRYANKPLTVHEMTAIIEKIEPHLFIGDVQVRRRDFSNTLSSPLGTQAKEGSNFYREKKEGDTNYKYGLLEWKKKGVLGK